MVRRTSGFVYYVSVAGVTGVKAADAAAVAPAVERVRAASGLPVAVGFGIRTPEQAARGGAGRRRGGGRHGPGRRGRSDAVAQNRDPVAKVLETAAALG